MHIDIVPNRGGTPTILLRRSYREDGKTKKETIANLSELGAEQIAQMRAVLRGDRLLPAAEVMEIVRSLPHGHVLAALGTARRIELDALLPRRGPEKAGEALAMVADGKDPAAENEKAREDAAREPDTVASVLGLFVKRHLEAKNRAPRYIEETKRNFKLHVLPKWKDRDIKTLTRRDVIELLDAVRDAENGRGGPVAANRVLAAVRAMFNFAAKRDIIEANPVSGIDRPTGETARERTLSPDEVQSIWQGAEALGYPFGPFFQIDLVTGQRRTEVARMRWDSLDLEASAMKPRAGAGR
jgi:hypothetical protein